MGIFDRITGSVINKAIGQHTTDPATGDSRLNGPVEEFVQKLLDVGVDGAGPVDGAAKVADKALRGRSPEQAVGEIVKDHKRIAATGGFVTGLGGFITMPVALPANVVEFYLTATRMVASIARVRGYDIAKPEVRSAILLTLVGADADDDLLRRAGVLTSGRLSSLATQHLPASAVMMINKGVGFRLISTLGQKGFAKVVGKGLPLVGGVVGGGMDYYLLGKIASNAKQQFPATAA
ncbi:MULTISPECIES: EcsC family protein [Arsenicicoccus]|uniref:EcsC family protein n=1 Tax=Arsenicicoccus bolidensis TaxID=229480 RepID=A0ABS9Q3P1_9MICO|nr:MULTISPECIES: EcsC family protein [Arsenicicoccus]MCG7322404.1 EcsC family protein [Arsenicicoccus bolidensis]